MSLKPARYTTETCLQALVIRGGVFRKRNNQKADVFVSQSFRFGLGLFCVCLLAPSSCCRDLCSPGFGDFTRCHIMGVEMREMAPPLASE